MKQNNDPQSPQNDVNEYEIRELEEQIDDMNNYFENQLDRIVGDYT